MAGEYWPWGDPHGYPHSPHPVSGNGELFLRGALACGITAKVGPVAITNGRFGNRPHCIYRGFCLQGCKVNAKASPLITHIPDALAHGAEVRSDSMVTHIEVDQHSGRATGVHTSGRAGRTSSGPGSSPSPAIRSKHPGCCSTPPRRRFPDGLCNDFDQVGRYLMVQGAPQTAGRFDGGADVEGPAAGGQHRAVLRNRPAKPYKRGFSVQTVSPLPITWAEHVVAQGTLGSKLREYMSDYVHWACLGSLCEFLPQRETASRLAAGKGP